MANIKKFEDFNFQEEEKQNGKHTFHTKSFLLGDLPDTVKFINCEKSDFSNGDETKITFYDYSKGSYEPHESLRPKKIGSDEYSCHIARDEYDFGFVITKNGVPAFIVSIYEPGAYKISERGIITMSGHEDVINLWVDDGHWERFHTR